MQLSNKRISLWLLPPEPLIRTLSSIQSDIISNHPKDRQLQLPRFLPHVTLVGGVPISDCCTPEELTCNSQEEYIDIDGEAAQIVLRRLQLAFQSHGGITCGFIKEQGVFAARTTPDDGVGEDIVQWNQSCVSIMERNSSLMEAIQVADEALFSTISTTTHNNDIERYFKPPLFEPHYSFVYGNEPHLIPTSLECPPSFTSLEMVLMWTSPSTLEGVGLWKEIGRINMI